MSMSYPTIPINQLDEWISRGQEMFLVDLRNKSSYERGHIKGAVNIPFEDLEDRLTELPRETPIVFYCSRGGQSMLACNHLQPRGWQVVNTAGGTAFYRGKYMVRT